MLQCLYRPFLLLLLFFLLILLHLLLLLPLPSHFLSWLVKHLVLRVLTLNATLTVASALPTVNSLARSDEQHKFGENHRKKKPLHETDTLNHLQTNHITEMLSIILWFITSYFCCAVFILMSCHQYFHFNFYEYEQAVIHIQRRF
jgi:hypothetical protein